MRVLQLCLAICVVYLLTLLRTSEGLSCMECANARSYWDCDRKGKIRKCDDNQNSCQTEIRRFGTWDKKYTVIRKSCKSDRACNRNADQNPAFAWSPNQCNPNQINSVCRCCCGTDNCNVGKAKCFGTCPYGHKAPDHGRYSCSHGTGAGSVCRFSCDYAYALIGSPTSRCGHDKKWSSPTPTCKRLSCENATAPKDGTLKCSKNITVGSVCRFGCNEGFEMVGSRMMICKRDGRGAAWSNTRPTCRLIGPRDEDLKNGVCTDENMPKVAHAQAFCNHEKANTYERNTECNYECNEGWMPTGQLTTKCVGNKGQLNWKEVTGSCKPQCHPRPLRLEHGRVSCKGNGSDEICEFSCNDEGYVLEGEAILRCIIGLNNSARWNMKFPVCKRELFCDRLAAPDFGQMKCSRATSGVETVCKFVCDSNRTMAGEASLECRLQGEGDEAFVAWTHDVPTCEEKRCPVQSIPHGTVNCTNGNAIGSECQFTCDNNYSLMPDNYCKNKCQPDQTYDSQPACCEPLCPPIVPGNLLILLEASNEMTMKDWNGFVSVVIDLLSNLVLGDESLRIAVLPFSDSAKHSHFINFTSNSEQLVGSLQRIRFREVKGASSLHTALNEVPSYFENLAPRVGGSADQQSSVMVFTTSKTPASHNTVLVQSAADQLSHNYEIMAVGYEDRGGDVEGLLNSIAGEGSFTTLRRGRCVSLWTDLVLDLMKKRLCRQRTCLHRNHDHAHGVALNNEE